MRVEGDHLVFATTGKRVYAHQGIVGIVVDPAGDFGVSAIGPVCGVYNGFDGDIDTPEGSCGVGGSWIGGENCLTDIECMELARAMIGRWIQFMYRAQARLGGPGLPDPE